VQTVPCRMDDNEWWGYPGYVARVHRAVL